MLSWPVSVPSPNILIIWSYGIRTDSHEFARTRTNCQLFVRTRTNGFVRARADAISVRIPFVPIRTDQFFVRTRTNGFVRARADAISVRIPFVTIRTDPFSVERFLRCPYDLSIVLQPGPPPKKNLLFGDSNFS